MSCMRGRRGTRFSPSSWWPRRWRAGRVAGWVSPRGCRGGWRNCWWHGRGGARVTRGRCWRGWRWRAGRWVRIFWARSPGWTRRRSAGGCGSWRRPGCSLMTPSVGGTGRGMRCWPRRWPAGCCPASGPCCTSAPRGRWRRPGTRRWPSRSPGTGRPRAARPRNCPPGWRRPRPPSGCSGTRKLRCTGSGPSS